MKSMVKPCRFVPQQELWRYNKRETETWNSNFLSKRQRPLILAWPWGLQIWSFECQSLWHWHCRASWNKYCMATNSFRTGLSKIGTATVPAKQTEVWRPNGNNWPLLPFRSVSIRRNALHDKWPNNLKYIRLLHNRPYRSRSMVWHHNPRHGHLQAERFYGL